MMKFLLLATVAIISFEVGRVNHLPAYVVLNSGAYISNIELHNTDLRIYEGTENISIESLQFKPHFLWWQEVYYKVVGYPKPNCYYDGNKEYSKYSGNYLLKECGAKETLHNRS